MKDTGAVDWGYMGVCLIQSFLDTQLQEKNDSIYYLRSPPQASTVLVECGMRLWYRMTCIMGTMRAMRRGRRIIIQREIIYERGETSRRCSCEDSELQLKPVLGVYRLTVHLLHVVHKVVRAAVLDL